MLPPLPAVAVIVYVFRLKVAVTFFVRFMVTDMCLFRCKPLTSRQSSNYYQEQPSDVTSAPDVYTSEQSDPQLMPAGEEVTMLALCLPC